MKYFKQIFVVALFWEFSIAAVPKCPAQTGNEPVLIPDPTDCTKFYICDNGIPYLHNCAPPLMFNPDIGLCDYAANVKCPESQNNMARMMSMLPTILDKDASIDCPEQNGDLPVYLPDPTNCSRFYECDSGVAKLHKCPGNLLFNTDLNVCDHPENVDCQATRKIKAELSVNDDLPDGCPPENGDTPVYLPDPKDCKKFYECDEGIPEPQECPDDLLFNPKINVCDEPENVECQNGTTLMRKTSDDPSSKCPAENGDLPVYIPDPSNCAKFYECDSGLAKSQKCSGDLLFNPVLNVCDFPENVDCDAEIEPSEVEKSIPDVKQSDASIDCPEQNGDQPIYLPDPTNCSRFYECDSGQAWLHKCPGDLLFNSDLNVCDFPENVQCKASLTAIPKLGGEHSAQVEIETVQASGDLDPRCPEENGDLPVYLPDPKNCSRFYECDSGRAWLHKCPGNLLFNPEINVCDQPENVKCEASSEKGDDTAQDKIESIQASGDLDPRCPEENGDLPVYLPDPTNCSRFYECDSGRAWLHKCPGNLLFNPEINVCDQPDNVDCAKSSEEEKTPEIAVQDDGDIDPRCPEHNGEFPVYIPDTTNCSRFYECDEGRAFIKECQNGLLFNPDISVCDQPWNVDCKVSFYAQTVCQSQTSVYLSHEVDCSKFYQCSNGAPYIFDCPAGLHYNRILRVCDWPSRAGCSKEEPLATR